MFSFDGSPPGNDIVEVIAVQEIMTRVTATHHQGYHRLIIASSTLCGNMLMNTLISTKREFISFVRRNLLEQIAVERRCRVVYWVPVVVPESTRITSGSTWKYQ